MSVLREARLRIETSQADAARRLRSAVDDVMDGGISLFDASRNRGVGYEALRTELEARGWKQVRPRQRRSRARKP